jgi:DNA invertase Pin-like site-specific DNA recombinase
MEPRPDLHPRLARLTTPATPKETPVTAIPARPAAYIRVAAAATTADDPRMTRQQHDVTAAARALGWPEPAVYADTGTAARPGSQYAALADAITAGQHDAVIITDPTRISRDPAQLRAFTDQCAARSVPVYLADGQQLTPALDTLYTRLTRHTSPG